MSWPFLLIIIPLLRSTRIDWLLIQHLCIVCVFTLCPKRLVGAPAPLLPVSPVAVCETARHRETQPETSPSTHTHPQPGWEFVCAHTDSQPHGVPPSQGREIGGAAAEKRLSVCVCVRKSTDWSIWNYRNGSADCSIWTNGSIWVWARHCTQEEKEKSPTRRFGEVFSVLEFYSLQGVL